MRVDNQSSITNTQAGGAVVVAVSKRAYNHQFNFEVSATPTTGTVTISGKGINSSTYSDIGTVDLTSTALVKLTYGVYQSFKFTPTSLDADKNFSVHITSWEDF